MDNYTWGQIQIETLKKMFINREDILVTDLDSLRNQNRYKRYLSGMAQAANEGISEIIKRGKPYTKTFNLTVKPIINQMSYTNPIYYDGSETTSFECDKGLSYYFEVDNYATITIYVNNVVVDTITNKKSIPGKFITYKGFLNNNDENAVKITFSGSNPYYIRNVAVYNEDYNFGDNKITYIPDYIGYYKYDMKSLDPMFYKLQKLYKDDNTLYNSSDYVFEDPYTLILKEPGFYKIKYQCYPLWIASNTGDNEEFNLDMDVAVTLPLYMASQLYKDDNIAIATQYRNEFEVALSDSYSLIDDTKFTSNSGWL